jgi:preprotein translocase subunit SecF
MAGSAARGGSFAHRLYTGQLSFEFIKRRRWWYLGSGLVILISVISLAVRGINPSIDFKGGDQFQFPTGGHSIAAVQSAVASDGIKNAVVQTAGAGGSQTFLITTGTLSQPKVSQLEHSLSAAFGANKISTTQVGPTWGGQITSKAIEALIVFLVVVMAYLSVRFEPKMALAAMVALLHDLVITAGIYSLSGFQVSPDTVIALLTILGYSLYDTVVVFDKVRENTQGLASGSRLTFSEATNLAVNQTLVRSINTSVIALLPVAGLLIIGAGLLGAGSLNDLSLALLIGLASGAYSSIFIASPLLTDLKEREPQFRALARRVAARRGREGAVPVQDLAVLAAGAGGGAAVLPAAAFGTEPSTPPREHRADGDAGPVGRPAADGGNDAGAAADEGPGAPAMPAGLYRTPGARPAPGARPLPGGQPLSARRRGGRSARGRKKRR